MGISTFPAPSAASKTRYVVTLLSGTSWTVPTGCLYVNARLFGAGSGGWNANSGNSGSVVASNLATTPAASISCAIGAGGAGASTGGVGGTTTFTGATSAPGGPGGSGAAGPAGEGADNGGSALNAIGGTGGAGKIELEYWV